MQYKAIVSFSGKISMAMGQVSEISDESLAKDLLNAGYIIEVSKPKKVEEPKEDEPKEPKEDKPKTKRKGKTNGN